MFTKNPNTKRYTPRDIKAFTFIEFLIAIGIMFVLIASVGLMYGNIQTTSQLNESVSQVIQALRLAKIRSFSRLNGSAHGVYFEINAVGNDKFILYQGSSYAVRQIEYDRTVILNKSLSFSAALSGTGDLNDINFSKGLGIPNKTGIITLNSDTGESRLISVNSFGAIEEQ